MSLNSKIVDAAKWSAITEIVAKVVSPVTNMILARLLAPEAFGVVATITMIISFADMFTDAGFQKYLVQHQFKNEIEKIKAINVAFWTNLFISILIWLIIILFSDKIAIMVGNPGLGKVITIACVQLPLTSFSSIQMAIYRREFNFKTLFSIRIVSICIPFFVTIPLALIGVSYWALIIGNIVGVLFNAILLTIKSKWKPTLFYSFDVLKDMISFSIWSLVEGISIWFTTWIDTFIIGNVLSSHYLGIYKNSLVTVNGVFAMITASTTPILFSALSRAQNDDNKFKKIFFKFQKIISYLVFPMAIGIFIYSDLVVKVLLGDKWLEAKNVIAIWGLISGIVIILGHYSSEVYRAKGRPKLSFLAQILHLIVLVPTCLIASKYDFNILVNIRAIIRLQFVVVHMIIMQFIIGISIKDIFRNVSISAVASTLMGIISILLKSAFDGIIWVIFSVMISATLYLVILICFSTTRKDILTIIKYLKIDKKFNKVFKINRLASSHNKIN